MPEAVAFRSYSSTSFATRYELGEVKDQLRMIQDNIRALNHTIQARDGKVSISSINLQQPGVSSSYEQDNRGFAVHDESNSRECHEADLSLG